MIPEYFFSKLKLSHVKSLDELINANQYYLMMYNSNCEIGKKSFENVTKQITSDFVDVM